MHLCYNNLSFKSQINKLLVVFVQVSIVGFVLRHSKLKCWGVLGYKVKYAHCDYKTHTHTYTQTYQKEKNGSSTWLIKTKKKKR